ncbi:MAG: L,D-transpeptidase family protein [Lacibacter sp.]
MKNRLLFIILLFAWVNFFISCSSNSNGKPSPFIQKDTIPDTQLPPDLSLRGSFSSQSKIKFDSSVLYSFFKQYPKYKSFERIVYQFYRNRKYAFAWFDENGLIEHAGNLYNKINQVEDEGLHKQILYQERFHALMEGDVPEISLDQPNTEVELMLTLQYFCYAQSVWTGISDAVLKDLKWDLPRKRLSYDAILDSLLQGPSVEFMQNEPVYIQYRLLKSWLKKLRSLEQAGGWTEIKYPKGKHYKLKDSSLVLIKIRERLFLTEDLMNNNHQAVFDESLLQGVKKFQQRHGYHESGVITDKLIDEMNVSVTNRIKQIIINMERCRWLPIRLSGNYFVINIPEFRFHAFENDRHVWSMKVVVGKQLNQTAVFNGKLKYVVFSPYWNIPPGIMRKEIVPALRRDKLYLRRNNMEWHGRSIRQKPGPQNALGLVKFLFPNSHNIYMHDTPSKTLFEQDDRAFSHGCIRIEQPKMLAQYVLRDQPEWTEIRIDSAMHDGKELFVAIKNPIPVYIAYFTTWVDAAGKLNFRKDIYKRDHKLGEAIFLQTNK